MDKNVLHECLRLALAGKMTFPQTIGKMIETGVERYRADLVLLEKIHYAADETHSEAIPLSGTPAIGGEFSAERVQSAIMDIQHSRIGYAEFLRRIMSAGVADYTVYLTGRKTIYNSRKGEFHIEQFPAQ